MRRTSNDIHAPEVPKLEALRRGLEAIRKETYSELGEKDSHRMHALIRLSRLRASRGRRLINTARSLRTWVDGVRDLTSHYILELANGHAVSHGSVDALPGPVHSSTYEWRNTVVGEDWRVDHNEVHHPHTNLVSKDPDFDLLYFRFSERRPWRPRHLVQVPVLLALPLATTWFIPLVAAAGRARHEDRAVLSFRTLGPLAKKVGAEWKANYLRPLMRSRRVQTVMGHWCAKALSNLVIGGALFASHHGEATLDLHDADDQDPAEFYLRQILCTRNFTLPNEEWTEIHLRGVNYHIEHHLFPDLPVERLGEVRSKVHALCTELGIPHDTVPLMGAVGGILRLALRFSLPGTTPTSEQVVRRRVYQRLLAEHRQWRALSSRRTSRPVKRYRVSLLRSGREVVLRSDEPLIRAMERADVEVPSGCRKGVCHSCKTVKVSGRTTQDKRGEETNINVCVARPRSDVSLDA